MQTEFSFGFIDGSALYSIHLSLVYSLLVYLSWKWARRRRFSEPITLNLVLILMISGMVGARAFHVTYEGPSYYAIYPLDILKVWQGGFVFYGGFFCALLSSALYLRRCNESFLLWADFFTPLGALGYGLGRFACFWAGCCYGKLSSVPWAINGRHPTQLYAAFLELIFAALLWWRALATTSESPQLASPQKPLSRKIHGSLFWSWMILHSIGRLFMESFRDDFRGTFIFGLSISSWISVLLLNIALTWFIMNYFSSGKILPFQKMKEVE